MDIRPTSPILLDEFWAYQVVFLADQISRYTLDVVRSEADLNLSQWRVLAAIADRPGRSAAEVTTVTPMDKTIVSRAVASLLQSGLIKRTRKAQDRRIAALEMTPLGIERYKLISAQLSNTLNSAVIDGLSTRGFTIDVKHFSQYMTDLKADEKS